MLYVLNQRRINELERVLSAILGRTSQVPREGSGYTMTVVASGEARETCYHISLVILGKISKLAMFIH